MSSADPFSPQLPEISYETTLVGTGDLTNGSLVVTIAYWSVRRSKYDPTEAWQVELRAAHESRDDLRALMDSRAPNFSLKGQTDSGELISIPRIRWSSHQIHSGVVTGSAYTISLGPTDLPSVPQQQWVLVDLTATPLARDKYYLFEQSFTGELMPHGEARPNLTFSSYLGRFELAGNYVFESARIGLKRALVRIPRAALILGPVPPRSDPGKLLDSIEAELVGLLRVLSILSRTPVNWSKIAVVSRTPPHHVETARYATPVRTSGRVPESLLLNVDKLPENALETVLNAFRISPYREAIQTAAGHLVSFFEPSFIEEKITSAFTALETLVQGIIAVDGKEYTLDRRTFKKLRSALSAAIESEGVALGVSQEQRDAITAKLPELNRGPLAPRLVALLDRFQVAWADLWPRGTVLNDALGEAFRVRNELIHAGKLADVDIGADAADRVHALAERLAFRLLEGDTRWISWQAYYHVYAISGQYPPHKQD